jgi:GTPase SAR1 family protein
MKMAHRLIVGMTGSGKTTLAKQYCEEYKSRGGSVLVFDPIGDTWPSEYVYNDFDEFCDVAKKSRNCLLIVDESAEAIGRNAGDYMWLGTRSRHLGHTVVFITQRPQGVDRMVRDQCEDISCFMLSKYDAEQLVREYPQVGLNNIHIYPKGVCREGSKFGTGHTFNVFTGDEINETVNVKEEKLHETNISGNIIDGDVPDGRDNNSTVSDEKDINKENNNEYEKLSDERAGSNSSNQSERKVPAEVLIDENEDDITLMFFND